MNLLQGHFGLCIELYIYIYCKRSTCDFGVPDVFSLSMNLMILIFLYIYIYIYIYMHYEVREAT
jgi:hypothetical protein